MKVLRVAAIAAAATLLLCGCVLDDERRITDEVVDQYTDATFYTLPATVAAGKPGDIIRSLPIESAPAGTRAWRVIYHSTDMAGTDIAVSGIVIVPDLPAPAEGRTIVSWAHPTTGSAAKCGPSLDLNPFELIEGMDELLAAGYAVAATDYQGMSLEGPSSYLLGVTEGNNVLDAARAARNLDGLDISSTLLLWGHSQGGQAALFAAQQVNQYAPELDLRGVAVAAPAADLRSLMSDDIINVSGVTIASYAIPAMEAAYSDRFTPQEMDAILTPAGSAAVPTMAAMCLLSEKKAIHAIADPLIGKFVTSDPSTTEPWATMLAENSAGASAIGVPIFVAQGLDDKLVIPSSTEGYVEHLCSTGEHVQFEKYADTSHGLIAMAAIPKVLDWFVEVVKGNPITSTC